MSQKNHWLGRGLLVAGIAIALGAGAVQALRDGREEGLLPAGSLAPALAGKGLDGAAVDLAPLRDRVVLLSFFATWCGACAEEMPVLRALERELAPLGFALVAADLDDDEPGRQTAISEFFGQGAGLPTVLLPSEEMTHAYRVNQLPTLYLLGRGGRIAATHIGAVGADALRKEIKTALSAGGTTSPAR